MNLNSTKPVSEAFTGNGFLLLQQRHALQNKDHQKYGRDAAHSAQNNKLTGKFAICARLLRHDVASYRDRRFPRKCKRQKTRPSAARQNRDRQKNKRNDDELYKHRHARNTHVAF